MRLSEHLKKIQNLPLIKRKVIFWLIIIIFGLILFIFWVMSVRQTVSGFQKEKFLEELKLPEFQEELEKLPKPNVEEEIKELKENVGEIEKLIEETKE